MIILTNCLSGVCITVVWLSIASLSGIWFSVSSSTVICLTNFCLAGFCLSGVLDSNTPTTAGDNRNNYVFLLMKRIGLLLFTVADDSISINTNKGAERQYLTKAIRCDLLF